MVLIIMTVGAKHMMEHQIYLVKKRVSMVDFYKIILILYTLIATAKASI